MQVGDLLVGDGEVEAIRDIHAKSGMDFNLPVFVGNPRFPVQLSIRHNGSFLAAALVHVDAEIYLFLEHEVASPQVRYEGLEMLQNELVKRVRGLGLDTMYCVLPPQVEKAFGRRLLAHGWQRDRGWNKYTFEL
jgi:hypothetical protein